ncbi:hypothetical protein [Prevotella sp. AM34-19LB]|uniref:hypothetical protein n=1 Tax=Prevotella sp. AM34-19LB TaxID=2292364 RepID=UPI0018F61CD1|nr:hypothetical protein [Prevotella sp. AM34-19LB]
MYGDCLPSQDGRNRRARREELDSQTILQDYRHRIKDIEVMEKMEQQEGMLPGFILGEDMPGYDLPF